MSYPCNPQGCQYGCDSIFSRVHISYLSRGETQISWQLHPVFSDPEPWTYQLQRTSGEVSASCDWTDIGTPVANTCVAYDSEPHTTGLRRRDAYRIQLTTTKGVYYSEPVSTIATLPARDWRIAREVLRKERLRAKFSADDGYLLKLRSGGSACPRCLEPSTGQPTDMNCPVCFGTGKECGYFRAIECVWADFGLGQSGTNVNLVGSQGTESEQLYVARMPMYPRIDVRDVWVSKIRDVRYKVVSMKHAVEVRTIPIIAEVLLYQLPFNDVAYSIQLPSQVNRLV